MRDRVVVMGVAAAGKTAVASAVAVRLGARFVDADDLHPPGNVAKMTGGSPLDDDDRGPWLDLVAADLAGDPPVVVACSALRRAYRDRLRTQAGHRLWFVHLVAERALLARRISSRPDHFMPPSLLDDQLAILEPLEPGESGTELDASLPLVDVVAVVERSLSP